MPLTLGCFTGLSEGSELRVVLKVTSRRNQIRLRHVVEDIETSCSVVDLHVKEKKRLLGDLIDSVDMVIDLVGL